MPRVLFADSIATRRNHRGLGAVPVSLAVHGLVIGAAALYAARPVAIEMPEPPLAPLTTPVLVSVTPPRPDPPAPTNTAPRLPRPAVPAPAGDAAPSRPGPLPDLTGQSTGLPTADGPALCLRNCEGSSDAGTGDGGFLVPLGDGAGTGTGDAPGRVVVGREIRPPEKIRDVAPRYPELARRAHIQGQVLVRCVIDTAGNVVGLDVVSGPPVLVEAAVDAVRQWRYKPTLLNGVPVEVEMTVTVRFALR